MCTIVCWQAEAIRLIHLRPLFTCHFYFGCKIKQFHYQVNLFLAGKTANLVSFFTCQGVLDITTTEVADYVVGGVMACDSSRFDAIIEKKVPFVLSVGALDMVNFGAKDSIPSKFQDRKIHVHNDQVILKLFRFCATVINQKVLSYDPFIL